MLMYFDIPIFSSAIHLVPTIEIVRVNYLLHY